jgi:hypothetical protein
MVHPDSCGIPRVPQYSGTTPETLPFRLQGYHPLWPVFPDRSTMEMLSHSVEQMLLLLHGPTTPCVQRQHAYMHKVWARPRSLATTSGISVDFFS